MSVGYQRKDKQGMEDYRVYNEKRLSEILSITQAQLLEVRAERRQITKKLQNLHRKRSQIKSMLVARRDHMPNQATQLALMSADDPDETYMRTSSFAEFAERAEKED
ncbi:hypothetical protein [Helicobacter salomonis]|uniref:hypothetical protein n=1 Tax=Helicobacter salomonis TaxID=56878 RepID=UPI000CF01318|nr:hypothetical protein [Helicobacter salomonis]